MTTIRANSEFKHLNENFLTHLLSAPPHHKKYMDLYDNKSANIPPRLYKYKFDDNPYKLSSILENKLFSNYGGRQKLDR